MTEDMENEKAQLILDTVLAHVKKTYNDVWTNKLVVLLDDEKQTLKDIKEIIEGEQE